VLSALATRGADASNAESHFRNHCAGCHGADYRWNATRTDEELARTIRNGLPGSGMPSFGAALSEQDIHALVRLIRGRAGSAASPGGTMVGATIEAEALEPNRSSAYRIMTSETDPRLRYIGYFDAGSYLCYSGIDLTGVRSIEFEYAKGPPGTPGRFAIAAYDDSPLAGPRTDPSSRIHLGEKVTSPTGDWEDFRTVRVGLSRPVEGRRLLCFLGLDGGGIFNLNRFTLSDQEGQNDGETPAVEFPSVTLFASGHSFRLDKVAEAPGPLWGMAFLPDGAIIATQQDGEIWIFRNGERLGPIEGTPKVLHQGQGGLLDIELHPDYASNGWLYLTYSHPAHGGAMTRVVRGRLNGLRWVDEQSIYTAPAQAYTDTAAHFGSRMVFHQGYLYFSIGERTQPELAQDLSHPAGKIHRLHPDGRVPEDNPFAGRPNAQASIWTYGHRNPQGIAVHPVTGALWSAEHGPMGGDELNVVRKGLNYGWPLVSFGKNYDGTIISESPYRDGVEPPAHHWTPSIGVSSIAFYTGDRFPRWRNQLLVGSLGGRQLHLVRIEGDTVVSDELVLQGLGRIRDVVNGPDGHPYVIFNVPHGMIYRLVPATSPSGS